MQSLPKREKIPFSEKFPNADPLGEPYLNQRHRSDRDTALDLLEKMLVFDPRTRISAAEGLAHEYLAPYHDPTDEPVAAEKFDWSFNDADLPVDTWKVMMYSEILGKSSHEHESNSRLILSQTFTTWAILLKMRPRGRSLERFQLQTLHNGLRCSPSFDLFFGPLCAFRPSNTTLLPLSRFSHPRQLSQAIHTAAFKTPFQSPHLHFTSNKSLLLPDSSRDAGCYK